MITKYKKPISYKKSFKKEFEQLEQTYSVIIICTGFGTSAVSSSLENSYLQHNNIISKKS